MTKKWRNSKEYDWERKDNMNEMRKNRTNMTKF